MKLRIATYLLVAAFFIGSITPTFSQSPEQLFQKGLVKEEGEGALNEAIDIYIKIVDNHDADKSLQAKALLHVGQCYEKLGRNEATKAYQRLVKNFPGQKNEVAIARKRLSRLILAIEEIAKTPLTPKFTKIKIPTKLSWNVALSPDGEDLALVSDNKLWRMPLSGNLGSGIPGTPVQLKTDSIKVEWTGLSWSRNGKWIAFNENPIKDKKDQSIYIVSSIGGTPKKIIENNRDVRTVNYRISLSPDGKKLAFTSVEDKKQYIQTISVNGENPQQLAEMQAREPAFSPDGKMIAFVEDKNTGTGSGDLGLWVVPASGGTPQLVANADMASSPVWSPDGKMIAYLDNSDGKKINIVPVSSNAITSGKVTSIDVPEGIEGIIVLAGWTPANEIGALVRTKVERGLYTLPAKGGQAAIVLYEENPVQPRWSPDSKKIYYTQEDKIGSWTSKTLAVVSTKGGKGKILTTQKDGSLNIPYQYQAGNRVSPDGKMIISAASSKEMVSNKYPSTQIWKIPVDGGTPTQITNPNPLYADFSPSWSPNGNKVAFLRVPLNVFSGKDTNETSLYVIKSTGGDPELLIKDYKYMWSSVWSPDGKMIAYHTYNKKDNVSAINVVNVIDGVSQIVTEIPNSHVHIELAWSPDSKQIAFNDNKGKVIKIITLSDGSVQDIETNLVDVTIYHLDWSPDGERFVFAGMKGGTKEFWFMEDFLPLDKLAQNKETEATKEPEGIRIRQISKKPYLDDLGTVSSDGKYLSCVDWGEGNLAIRDLESGKKKILTNNATLDPDPQKFVIGSAISKNGKFIAYSWWRPNHTLDLHIFDTEKNTSKLLFKEEEVEVYPSAWLSDEKLITIKQNRNEETSQITLFNVSDGTFQNLKSLDKRQWAQLCTSPDEEYIAYNTIGGGNSDINVLTADGKFELPLVVHPANDKVIGWIPGRKDFLFTSDRSGTWDLWTLPVMNGKPVGEAKRLFTEFGDVAPIGITEKGECFFGFSRRNFNAYITSVDRTTGKPDKKPKEVLAGSVYSNSWSPNGEYMACIKQKKRSFELILQDTNNGNERRLAKELAYVIGPYWSRDGNSIYIFGRDQEMRQTKGYKGAIYTVDVETGDINENLQISEYKYTPSVDDALPISGHVVSDDNKYTYLLFQNDWIVKRNLANGTNTILYRHPGFVRGVLKLSPDGKKLLFAVHDKAKKQSRLITISVNGGDERKLCTSQEAKISESALWSPNGKSVYFTERPEGTNLWRVSAEGGKPEKVWHTDKRAESFAMHPSGNEISYSVRERTTEIRVMEGLVRELEKIYSQNE